MDGDAHERLTREILRCTRQEPNSYDLEDTVYVAEAVKAALQASIFSIGGSGGNCEAVTLEVIVKESASDTEMKQLVELVRNGTTDDKNLWPERLSNFHRVRNSLSEKDGVLFYKSRVVVPSRLRGEVLDVLHAAHQGCSSMEARASQSVW